MKGTFDSRGYGTPGKEVYVVLLAAGPVSDVFRRVPDLRIGVPGSKFDAGADFEVHLSSTPPKPS